MQIATGDWRVQKPKYGFQGRRADKGGASVTVTVAATIRLQTQTVFSPLSAKISENFVMTATALETID